MPEMDGLTCLDRIMIETPCPVVMVSSMTAAGADATLEALRLGAVDFVAKPTGAVSLRFDDLARPLIEKVRAAAGARLKTSLRLRERVRFRIGDGTGASPAVRQKGQAKSQKAKVWCWLGPRPAVRRPWKRFSQAFRRRFLGPSSLPSTCRPRSRDRWRAAWTESAGLSVQEVRDPIALKPGNVYIGRGDADVIVSRRGAGLVAMAAPAQADYPWHPSTDRLVRSALNYMAPSQLIGILMTGMGNDGAEAMALIHAGGGRTIAEAEETAVVWGMPGELVKANGASFVVPLQ